MLAWNCLGALIAPVLGMWFIPHWSISAFWRTLLTGLAYSQTIGTMATATFILVFPRLKGRSGGSTWWLVIACLLVLAVLGSYVATALLVVFRVVPIRFYWSYSLQSMQFALPITLGLGVVTGLLQNLHRRLDRSNQLLREREAERERAVQLATEARLSSLESRVHPHFLFNALNSISSLIREDPVRAERLIERMAALLRFSLDSSNGGTVPLGREMKIVGDYLEIEKARFGDRLQFSIAVDSEVEGSAVPALAVQTLVENAVKFAVAPRREGGSIEVSAQAADGVLRVEVWDDGALFDLASVPVGHGLENLQQRLGSSLSIEPRDGGKAVVMCIPLRAAQGVS